MFVITGKTKAGKSFRAQLPLTDAGEAVKTLVKNLPDGESIAVLIIKPAQTDGFIKFAKPRGAKGGENGATPSAASDTPKRRR